MKQWSKCVDARRGKVEVSIKEDSLPIDVYRFWFNALAEDNVKLVTHLLSSTSAEERNRLLNGQFDYMEDDLQLADVMGNTTFRNPLSVCVIYASFEVLPVMMEYGVIVDKPDYVGNNLLHLLVNRVVLKPEEECQIIDVYR